jgi:hypothetical protein
MFRGWRDPTSERGREGKPTGREEETRKKKTASWRAIGDAFFPFGPHRFRGIPHATRYPAACARAPGPEKPLGRGQAKLARVCPFLIDTHTTCTVGYGNPLDR